MKLTFLGVGAAFTTPAYYQSNMLITVGSGQRMLIDCGSDIRFSLPEVSTSGENAVQTIDAVYISHLHSDHIGGLEYLAFTSYFSRNQNGKKKLFMEERLMHEMWNHSLQGGLGCIEGKRMHLTDYFTCCPLPGNGSFLWEGIRFELEKMPHVLTGYKDHYSFGLFIAEAGTHQGVFLSTDTQFKPDFITDVAKKAVVIFHDCETAYPKSRVHAHYEDLCTLPDLVKQKIWLYHYQPDPTQQPSIDGFKGFVVKGQEFDFVTAQDV